MSRIIYQETQHISRLWLFVVIFDALLCCGVVYAVSDKMTPFELSITLCIVVASFGIIVWILLATQMHVEINDDGLRYRYPVFRPAWRIISKKSIRHVEIKTYDAIFDFGGWGHKRSKKHGTCVTIQGDTALFIELTTNERYLIGTQNKEGILHAMKRILIAEQ